FLYSPSNPFLGSTPNIASTTTSNLVLKTGAPLNSRITWIPVGAAPGSNISSSLVSNAGDYNLNLSPGTGRYGLRGELGTEPRTKSLSATLRQSISDAIQLFSEWSTDSNK